MDNHKVWRDMMRNSHHVICSAIFSDGGRMPVGAIDYEFEEGENYQKISTQKYVYMKLKYSPVIFENKKIKVNNKTYEYYNVKRRGLSDKVAIRVFARNNEEEKYNIEENSKLYNRIIDMFSEVFK